MCVQEQHAETRKRVQDESQHNATLLQQNRDARDEAQKLSDTSEQQRKEVARLKAALDDQASANSVCEKRAMETAAQLASEKERYGKLAKEKEGLRAVLESTKKELASARGQLQDMEELRGEVLLRQKECESVCEMRASLQKELKDLEVCVYV